MPESGVLMKHISETLPKISTPTGQPEKEGTQPMPTGRELGRPGYELRKRDLEMVLPRMLEMEPGELDASLEGLLPPCIASSISEIIHDPMTMGSDPARNFGVVGYEIGGQYGRDDAEEALETLRRLSRPCGREFATKELGRVKVLTKSAKADSDDIAFQFGVMAEELAEYPADVVRDSCRFYAKRNTWFPSWHELRELCEERFLKRECLLRALERYFRRAAQ